jgi:hypothetical protein
MRDMLWLVVAVVVALAPACRSEEEPAETKAPEKAVKALEAEKAKQQPVQAKKPEPPQEGCGAMFVLLKKCNPRSPAFSDPRFRTQFIRNCEQERKRPTAYAKRFAECVESTTCDGLKQCSEGMRAQAMEVGPEHMDWLLMNNQRDAAVKFCDDHREELKGAEPMEKRCRPLLEMLDQQREEHQHNGQCNHAH